MEGVKKSTDAPDLEAVITRLKNAQRRVRRATAATEEALRERVEAINAASRAGMSERAIAAVLGVTGARVHQVLNSTPAHQDEEANR